VQDTWLLIGIMRRLRAISRLLFRQEASDAQAYPDMGPRPREAPYVWSSTRSATSLADVQKNDSLSL
jgi:hypothetical protein